MFESLETPTPPASDDAQPRKGILIPTERQSKAHAYE